MAANCQSRCPSPDTAISHHANAAPIFRVSSRTGAPSQISSTRKPRKPRKHGGLLIARVSPRSPTRPMVTHSPHVNAVAWCKSKKGADGGMAAPAPVPSKCSDDGVWIAFWDANRRAHPLNCHPEGPQRPQSRCHRPRRYLPTHIGSVKTWPSEGGDKVASWSSLLSASVWGEGGHGHGHGHGHGDGNVGKSTPRRAPGSALRRAHEFPREWAV